MNPQSSGDSLHPAEAEGKESCPRHWHLFARHVHPEWHGHCKGPGANWRDQMHSCDRVHWHFLFRHRHTETGR